MIIVLDSNEYINYLSQKVLLLDKIVSDGDNIIHINETITKEVINNLSEPLIKNFYDFLFRNNINVSYRKMPFSLFNKYKNLGLKKGDIAIAAFCDMIGAEYLISENRHFLKGIKNTKFKIVNVGQFLKKL